MKRNEWIALLLFWISFLAIAYYMSGFLPEGQDFNEQGKTVTNILALPMMIGQVLCWIAGWKKYKEEKFGTNRDLIVFVVYVGFAQFTLPFRNVVFP